MTSISKKDKKEISKQIDEANRLAEILLMDLKLYCAAATNQHIFGAFIDEENNCYMIKMNQKFEKLEVMKEGTINEIEKEILGTKTL